MDITLLTAAQGPAQARPTKAGNGTGPAPDGEGFAQRLARLGGKSHAAEESGRSEPGKPVSEPAQERPEEATASPLMALVEAGVLSAQVAQVTDGQRYLPTPPAGEAPAELAGAADGRQSSLAAITERMALIDNAGRLTPMTPTGTMDGADAGALGRVNAPPLTEAFKPERQPPGQPMPEPSGLRQQGTPIPEQPGPQRQQPITVQIDLRQAEQMMPGQPKARLPSPAAAPMQTMADSGQPPLRSGGEAVPTVEPPITVGPTMTGPALTPAAGTQPIQPLTATATLSAPVATPAWQRQLGQQLVGLALRPDQSMELHLNPAELGPLQVSLKLVEQGAQAHFISAHAPVRQALEQAIPQLREALAEQGITLGEASIGEQGGKPDQSFAREPEGRPSSLSSPDESSPHGAAPNEVQIRPLTLNGQVDLYA
ncbi:flagellar hook-length control protein FliK [Zobellella aerophila]|uniref:Flagellar hook-length control protein-like C-terminal domain-containing protein n=1 Tax=Zobellella aerophila TaxID=870480 RepID=A0ABP6VV39_9GAMM